MQEEEVQGQEKKKILDQNQKFERKILLIKKLEKMAR